MLGVGCSEIRRSAMRIVSGACASTATREPNRRLRRRRGVARDSRCSLRSLPGTALFFGVFLFKVFCMRRMEETVRAMLAFKKQAEQLRQEKAALTMAFEVSAATALLS